MDQFYRRFSVVTGFAILLVVLLANTFITKRQLDVQVSDQTRVARSRRVMYELSQTESVLKDAETGQRGFLYTDNSKYLAPYHLAITQVESHLQSLAQLTADNPSQQTKITHLHSLVENKLSELAQTISLHQAGRAEDARAIVLSDQGLILMDNIRQTIDEMEAQETSIETTRQAAYRESIRRTEASIFLATFAAILGLAFLAYYILRELNLREKHALQLHEREEWFRVTLTSLGDAVIATDRQGHVTFLNPLAEKLTGRQLILARGKPIHEIFPIFNESTHHPVENPVKKVMELGRVVGLANHTVLQHSNGTLTPIEDSAAPIRDGKDNLIGVVLVFRDATYERKSQEILRKTEKLAAAARLAATVAHEINNPLEAIGNLLYLTKNTPGMPTEAVEHLELAEQELDRVSHITRQTLGFYRESNEPGPVEVPVLIDSILRLYSNKLNIKNISVERNFGDCPPVHGLEGELKQAISNLISNAADAVSNNGTIRVNLSCIEVLNGRGVQVLIEDDGPGIAPEYIDRIFEPFFTTKKDVGTGLGLWVTKEIVSRHGGSIHVHSQHNHVVCGTSFNLRLPCTEVVQNFPAEDI